MIPGLCSIFQTITGSSGGMSAIADPAYVEGLGTGMVSTSSTGATPLGGTGPYTYLWEQVGGDPNITIGSNTASSTDFSATVSGSDYITGYFVCTITDSAAHSAATNQVTAVIAVLS